MAACNMGGAFPGTFVMMRGLVVGDVFSTSTFHGFPWNTDGAFHTFTFTTL